MNRSALGMRCWFVSLALAALVVAACASAPEARVPPSSPAGRSDTARQSPSGPPSRGESATAAPSALVPSPAAPSPSVANPVAQASPSPSPPPPAPPPPPDFDPSRLPWLGDAGVGHALDDEWSGQLWRADGLDGRGLRQLTTDWVTGATPVAGGRFIYIAGLAGRESRTALYLLRPGRPPKLLLTDANNPVVAADGTAVFVTRHSQRAGDAVWCVPLDGSPPERVAAARLWPPRTHLAVSADGRWLASGTHDQVLRGPIELRLPGGEIRTLRQGVPIGFDDRHRLYFQVGLPGPVIRYDAAGRTYETVTPTQGWARFTPDGRHLVLTPAADGVGIELIDTNSDALRTLDLITSDWFATWLGDERYVVLEGDIPTLPSTPGRWLAIIDTEEGWVGYLPPVLSEGNGSALRDR